MKNIYRPLITLILCILSAKVFAQVAIGKDKITNPSVSLEFGEAKRGIVLPYVNDVVQLTSSVEGTIAFDLATGKVRFLRNAEQRLWEDLSVNTQNFNYLGVNIADTTGKADASIQQREDLPTAQVQIGKNITDPAPGILVLSDNNKAMILPKVESPHLNILNPAAGMMAYDTKTNQLAIFNGTVWTFWQP